jgi:hypothetical protein
MSGCYWHIRRVHCLSTEREWMCYTVQVSRNTQKSGLIVFHGAPVSILCNQSLAIGDVYTSHSSTLPEEAFHQRFKTYSTVTLNQIPSLKGAGLRRCVSTSVGRTRHLISTRTHRPLQTTLLCVSRDFIWSQTSWTIRIAKALRNGCNAIRHFRHILCNPRHHADGTLLTGGCAQRIARHSLIANYLLFSTQS